MHTQYSTKTNGCLKTKSAWDIVLLFICLLSLSGCKALNIIDSSPSAEPAVGPIVGPGSTTTNPETGKKPYTYNSDIYLDVVIPVFDPGLPLNEHGDVDYQQVGEQGIWPQLRRAEANRFAVETKRAIGNIGAFGAVSVVPDASASGDVYVLGHIDHSDSETIKLTVNVLDSQSKSWGKKQFEHHVSPGFFRDKNNAEKDPYEPVFNHIADYLYQLLKTKSEQEKDTIKAVTELRYAQLYAPELFGQHLRLDKTWDGNYYYTLLSLPSENDTMTRRIAPLRLQDQRFIDRLQIHYEGFNARSDESYRAWQKETLPKVVAFKEVQAEKSKKITLGILSAVAAAVLSNNSNSTVGNIGTTIGALASAVLISDALGKNEELKVHKVSLDEMGESLDIELSPQVIAHNEQTIELTGTANEQYQQWRSHLQAIYALEKTPDTQL